MLRQHVLNGFEVGFSDTLPIFGISLEDFQEEAIIFHISDPQNREVVEVTYNDCLVGWRFINPLDEEVWRLNGIVGDYIPNPVSCADC